MAQLRYVDQTGKMQIVPLASEAFLIGRAVTCQLTIDDEKVSREHARLDVEEDGRYRLRDLGARNKTFVNGQLITETLLNSGDMLRIGDEVIEYLEDDAGRDKLSLDFLTPDRKEPEGCEWFKIKSPITLTIRQIEQLSGLAGHHGLTARPADLADGALAQVLVSLKADRGFIALRGDAKMDLHPIAQRALLRAPSGSLMPVSQNFVFSALLQSVVGRYPDNAANIDAKSGYAAAGMVAPLTSRGSAVGLIYVDRPVTKRPFSSADAQQLAAAGGQIGALLADATSRLTRASARESAVWMASLRRHQAALATAVEPTETFDVASESVGGTVRCGDFCDVIHIDDQRCCVVLVDGGGHGLSGLAQAAAIRMTIRAVLASSEDALADPVALFGGLNQTMAASRSRQVVPCTYLGLDLSAGRITYVNAGGMPPVLMSAPGRLVTLDQPSLVLGVDPGYVYEVTRVDLPSTFRLVCCSDGLIDAANASGESLGDQRVHEALLGQEAFGTAAQIVALTAKTLQDHLAGEMPQDDATVLVLARG